MNLSEEIQHLDLSKLIIVDGENSSRTISLRENFQNYGRISRDQDGFAYGGWLQGKGHGNILVLGMLQESIKLGCDIITGSPKPFNGTRLGDLIRFYGQFGLKYDIRLSKRRGMLMYSGEPFKNPGLCSVIAKVRNKYKLAY